MFGTKGTYQIMKENEAGLCFLSSDVINSAELFLVETSRDFCEYVNTLVYALNIFKCDMYV